MMIASIISKGVQKSRINQSNIKRDLSTVIRTKRDISQSRVNGKSRLKKYLEKEQMYQGVIRRNGNSRSKSKRGNKQEIRKKQMIKENEHKSSFDKSQWFNVRTSQNSLSQKPIVNQRRKFIARSFKNLYH